MNLPPLTPETLPNMPESARHFVLGGKVALHQARDASHKAGLDAVMLAASVPPRIEGRHIVDLGAGVGTAGLCVARRCENTCVTLVENDPAILLYAERTLADEDNAEIKDRITLLKADVTLSGEARVVAGLVVNMADHVIMNPPYRTAGTVRQSENESRTKAHILGEGGLEPWIKTAAAITRAGGWLSMIFPTDGLPDLLSSLKGRFGAITVFPLFRGEGETANRLVVMARKGSNAPLKLASGLVLHGPADGATSRRPWTSAANAVLNGETGLFI